MAGLSLLGWSGRMASMPTTYEIVVDTESAETVIRVLKDIMKVGRRVTMWDIRRVARSMKFTMKEKT